MSLEDQLPDEPGPDCLEPISILRFRMPNNESITRRFLASNPLKVRLQIQHNGVWTRECKYKGWTPILNRKCCHIWNIPKITLWKRKRHKVDVKKVSKSQETIRIHRYIDAFFAR